MSDLTPNSKLSLQKPELWGDAVRLATKLTGYQLIPKLPSQDGVIYACGWTSYYTPPTPQRKIVDIDIRIGNYKEELEREDIAREIRNRKGLPFDNTRSREIISKIGELKRQRDELDKQRIEDEIENDKRKIKEDEHSIEYHEIEEELEKRSRNKKGAAEHRRYINEYQQDIVKRHQRIEDNSKKLDGQFVVPEGAMEWLLHEVGHWLAATKEERTLPSYGFGIIRDGECTCTKNFTECRCGDEREWQAWAFEQIILGRFGDARNFAPPSHRGGIAYYKNEPIPDLAFQHIESALLRESVDIEEWQNLWGQWIRWGYSLKSKAPWEVEN